MHYKKFLLTTLFLILFLLSLAGGINYVVDPLQFYHRAWFYPPVFSVEQRYQNPGLARNYGGDCVIIGSSMAENFVPWEVDRMLGVKSVKLAMSGATAREEALMLDLALGSSQVKEVLWGLDFGSLKGSPQRVRDEDVPFPYYMYDRQPLNDAPYLLSVTVMENSLRILYNHYHHIPTASPDLQYLNNWSDKYWFNRQPLLQKWQEEQSQLRSGVKQYDKVDGSLSAMEQSVEANVLPVIKSHPGVKFVIYYPPYSILRYRSIWEEDPQQFYAELGIKKYIFQQLGDAGNVEIYDFQADSSLTFQLDNYKDYSHYSTAYNQVILTAIAGQDPKYLVANDNPDRLIGELHDQVVGLDVATLFAR